MELSEYLTNDLIFHLSDNIRSRDEAIRFLADQCAHKKILDNEEVFYQAIQERESLVSTGIGMGIAIPHAKLDTLENFFVLIAIHKQGIEWKSLDGELVHLIFLIGGPSQQQTEYLKLLSSLTLFLKNEKHRNRLLETASKEGVFQLFQTH